LRRVVFLYDLAITAQTRLAAGRISEARELLRRIAREWPRSFGGFGDSLDLAYNRPFDQIKGVPRVSNGPNMLLALSALTVWAAGDGRDADLLRMARQLAELILQQMKQRGDGAIPYGPGNQSFPDGTSFRTVFHPEYQIDAYALFHRIGQATGEPAWETAAVKAIDWLVANRYDRAANRFWSRNDQGTNDSPLDVPGWAMSMVGPGLLSAKGVDVPTLVADLGSVPERVIPTEWLVNRRNGLKIGADYLAVRDRSSAEQAKSRLAALDAILFGLPLQPDQKGGGLAYAYRQKNHGREWEAAEDVPTGWGWNTQRGSSRVSADYLLSSLAHDHDPVRGTLNGRALQWRPVGAAGAASPSPSPAASTGQSPAASVGTVPAGSTSPPEITSYRLRTSHRNLRSSLVRLVISRMLLDATPGANAPAGAPPIISIRPHGGGSVVQLTGWDAFEDLVSRQSLVPGDRKRGWVEAINLRNRLEEEHFLVTEHATVDASNGYISDDQAGRRDTYRFILIDPAKDFDVTQRFFHLWAEDRARDLRETADSRLRAAYEGTPSYEEWARSRTGVTTVIPQFDPKHGFFQKVPPDGAILAHTAKFVTIDPETGELTDVSTVSYRNRPEIKFAFKRPISREEWVRLWADLRSASASNTLGLVEERTGQYFQWTPWINADREQAFDVRVLKSLNPSLELGHRVVIAPSQRGIMTRALKINSYLSAQGFLDGMVLSSRPSDSGSSSHPPGARQPGWIFLRPRLIGKRTREWEFLKTTESLRRKATDDRTRLRLRNAYREGERVLNWLADIEAHLHRRQARGTWTDIEHCLENIDQARANIWIWKGPMADCRLIVGSHACKDAAAKLKELDLVIASNPAAVPDLVDARSKLAAALAKAHDLGFDRPEPRLSRYEEVFREYLEHIKKLRAEVQEREREHLDEPDERHLLALQQARKGLQDDVQTMSFRGSDGQYYALVPGFREAEAMTALVEEAEGVPLENRESRSVAVRSLTPGDLLALLEPDATLTPRSQEQMHLRYQVLYTDPAGHTLVEVSSDHHWLHRFEVYDSIGLIGKFQGRIRVNGKPAAADGKLTGEDRVEADFFIHLRYGDATEAVGEDLVPLAQLGPTAASRLTLQALRSAAAAHRPNAPKAVTPLFSTTPEGLDGTVVKVHTRHDGATYYDYYLPRTAADPEVRRDRRVYDAVNEEMETYHGHQPNPVTAEWMPGRVEVWFQKHRTEIRTLLGFDDQGRASYRIQTLGLVPTPLVARVPLTLRQLLPVWIRTQPGPTVERVDTREVDGLLYCRDLRGPGAINERTYYDVDRERTIFAATGQNIEIPQHTYHSAYNYSVARDPCGTPFVWYKIVHNPETDMVVTHLASYELNVESTYDAAGPDLVTCMVLPSVFSASQWAGTVAAGIAWLRHEGTSAAPQPREVRDLVKQHDLHEPPRRLFRWSRRLHVLGRAGQHNQRGESLSELLEVEVEDETSLVHYIHELQQNDTGTLRSKERARQWIPKTPDGRFYIRTADGRIVTSDARSREVPSGFLDRRIPEPDGMGRCPGSITNPVWTYTGEPGAELDAEGLLPVSLRGYDALVARAVREDAFERAAKIMQFPAKGPFRRSVQHRVVQVVDPDAWYWHPQRRHWYPRAIARYTDNILDERRELCSVNGVPQIDLLNGQATYMVQPYYRGEIPSLEIDPASRLGSMIVALDDQKALRSVLRFTWAALEAWRTIKASVMLHPAGNHEIVVAPNGSLVERRDHLITLMDLPRGLDSLARSGYECVIPAAAYDRTTEGERGAIIARFQSELSPEGRFLTVTRKSTLSSDWAKLVYERDPAGVQDLFGRWSHWRLVSEQTGNRPGEVAFQTLVFYKGDKEKQEGLFPEVGRKIDAFLERERHVRRGRGYRAPDSGEIGRAVFDYSAAEDAQPALYQFNLGVWANDRQDISAPYFSAVLHDCPGAEPVVRLTDHAGRPAGETFPGPGEGIREVAERDVVFDRARFVWTMKRTRVVEAKPPGYLSIDRASIHPPGRLVPSQVSRFVDWSSTEVFYPDSPRPLRLKKGEAIPTTFVGNPDSQSETSFHDDLGRPWIETHTTRSGETSIKWLTYYPQVRALEFQPAAPGGVLPLRFVTGAAGSFDHCDFLMFFVRGRDADSARLWYRNGGRDLVELPRLGAWGQGCWSPEFDEPIVLESRAEEGTSFRIIAARPMRGNAPHFPLRNQPRTVIVPVAWLRERGVDLARLELRILAGRAVSSKPAAVEVTPVERLISPTGSRTWHPSAGGQATLFPVGPSGERIEERAPKVIELGNDVVVIFRGCGPASKALVYDQGRLVAATFYHRDGRAYDHVRVRFADTRSPYLRLPLYFEAASNGWLGRLVQPIESSEGRALWTVSNVNQPLAASLFPYGGGKSVATGIMRSGNNPVTIYPPLGVFDPESAFPRLGASLINALFRTWYPREGDPLTQLGRLTEHPARKLLDPQHVRALVEQAPMDLPFGWPWRPIPEAPSPPDEARRVRLPNLQAWADDIETMIKKRPAIPLPETHPGTARAGFAETHVVAGLIVGLVKAARAAPDRALSDRRLATASRVLDFYQRVTSHGQHPALSAYRTKTGARLAFSEEWGQPAIAIPTARANVALARAALELTRETGDPESWKFACRLMVRVLEFVPDADPLWPRDAADRHNARQHAVRLAARLVTAWSGGRPDRRVNRAGVEARAQRLLGDGKLSPPFEELLRRFMTTGMRLELADSETGEALCQDLITEAFLQGHKAILEELADGKEATSRTVPHGDARTNVARLLEVALGETEEDRDRLVHWFRACGGLCEHPPRIAVGLPEAGLTLTPETDRYELPTNADALDLLEAMARSLENSPGRDQWEQKLYDEVVVARARLADWFRYVILPVVAKTGGHAPNHWRQQCWLTGVLDTTIQGREEPHVIVPNRWTTLESSLAAARAALAVDDDTAAAVGNWLANLLKVYGSVASGPAGKVSGMSYAPDTFARYEGLLYSGVLTLEYAAIARQAKYDAGIQFAEGSVPTFLALNSTGDYGQMRTAAGPGPFPARAGVETGDGQTVYTRSDGSGEFGWSPAATLLLAEAVADAEARSRPLAVESVNRLAMARGASRATSAEGQGTLVMLTWARVAQTIGATAGLLALVVFSLVLAHLDMGREREKRTGGSRSGRVRPRAGIAARRPLLHLASQVVQREVRG